MGFVDRLVWVGEALGRALDRPRYRIDDAGHLLTEPKKVDTAVPPASGDRQITSPLHLKL